jgi:predicted nucleic acid-binding Zn ribbon protein
MNWPGKKKSDLTLSSDVLHGLFENGKSALSSQFIRWKLWRKWNDYVGPTISKNTEPVGYYKGTLHVWVKNSSWMQQMMFMSEHIQNTINKKLEDTYVKEIKWTLYRKEVPDDALSQDELKQSIDSITSTKS